MISNESKKEAIRSFKERKPQMGAYAIRCTVTGSVWVGASRNIEATKNGSWFTLRTGLHREKPLQQEWNANGEANFTFEALDCIDSEAHPLEVDALLKETLNRCVDRFNANKLL